ncbi:uncharacterized protein LOC141862953 isoform X1 [Acropora palmata]|uniref:uncharacterized protein LOC141862953 isoform X1 n=1 Tax=Acropora palmata TaxID=6131 RepID=UPI003DA16E29
MGSALTQNTSAPKSKEMAQRSSADNKQYLTTQEVFETLKMNFAEAQRANQQFWDCGNFILQHQTALDSEIEKYRERLARFSIDHARQGQANVENVASANRPSVLERKFVEFRDYERMDAVYALQRLRSNSKVRDQWTDEFLDKYVACMIFEHSYDVARSLKRQVLQGMNLLLMSAPAFGEQFSEQVKKKTTKEIHFSIDMSKAGSHEEGICGATEDSLTVTLRETAEQCDVSSLVKRTLAAISKMQEKGVLDEYIKTGFMENPNLKKYVEECCKYSWNLVCQTPPYEIEGNLSFGRQNNKVFDPAKHEVSSYSKQDSSIIHAVIWPCLLGPSKRVIRKAEVLLEATTVKPSRVSVH